ncbi:MAG: hypothetical protein AAF432_12845 [Planctomycetota bacterium]
MRCKTCDYPLWNLTARQCPECGEAFRPSEFEFVPNSVRYCCTSCGQTYYGTDDQGHLVPPAFACVKCNAPQTMDAMVLLPASGIGDRDTQMYRLPWVERKKIGMVRAWWRTAWASLFKPSTLMRSVPSQATNGEAWGFATYNLLLVIAVYAILIGGGVAVIGIFAGGAGAPSAAGLLAGTGIGLVVAILIGMLFFYVVGGVWTAGTHLILRWSGETRGGIGLTGQAIAYSSGTMCLALVPCIVNNFAPLWWVISACGAVKEAQNVSWMRAIIATSLMPVTLAILFVAGYIALIWFSIAQAQAGFNPIGGNIPVSVASYEVDPIAEALLRHADENGAFPAHAIELYADDHFADFGGLLFSSTLTYTDDVPVADADLDVFLYAGLAEQERMIADAAAALPADVSAHRLGDVVFTYHGIDANTANSELWLFITSIDPDQHGLPATGISWQEQSHFVGLVDGTVKEFPTAMLRAELIGQNVLRRSAGLAPIDRPYVVTHANPGRAATGVAPEVNVEVPDPRPELEDENATP